MHTVKTKGESNRASLLEKELTEKTLGAAFKVQNTLGSGFLEKVYENAMVVELSRMGVPVEQQKPLQVRYEGTLVGDYQADLVIGGRVIVELKAASKLDSIHEAQLLNYLKATRVRAGLLFDFGCPRLQYRRFVV
jgi:GxxExxY protein